MNSTAACAPACSFRSAASSPSRTRRTIREAAARCPLDRLLVETDSPFLAPVPHRGRANEPALLPLVGATVAEVKGCAVEAIAASTAAAAAAAFAIPA